MTGLVNPKGYMYELYMNVYVCVGIIETLKLSTYLIRNPDKLFKPQRRNVVNKYILNHRDHLYRRIFLRKYWFQDQLELLA